MKRILVVYHSQEKGNTRAMAELVAEGCRQVEGVEVALVNVNEERVDIAAAEQADGYALGSPDYFSYMAGGLKQFFDDLCLADWGGKKVKGKPYVAFLTHGGGGSAIASIEKLAKAMKLEPAAPSIVCKGAPAGEAVEQSRQLGKALAERVTQ
ncbi:MAG TPA: NAD(P)H-dependent oxidoreductase [Planctomycetota bacterium]|nr:NAD(P)H-dependent oxidoreductase [Planctomycetota bacterium]